MTVLFIRDDIRVRDLDARYKRTMRRLAGVTTMRYVGIASWNKVTNIPIWGATAQFEKLCLKGA